MRNFGGMGQMGQMMKQNIKKAQELLANIDVTGEAGNGAVKVTMSCKNVCKRVEIDDSLLGSVEDKDMLEDLLTAALNDTQKKIEAEVEQKMAAATGGMKLPF